jgi:hypothetical protein
MNFFGKFSVYPEHTDESSKMRTPFRVAAPRGVLPVSFPGRIPFVNRGMRHSAHGERSE